MKNVNLTGLFLALVASCDVTGFELSCLRKIDSLEPSDAQINFFYTGKKEINVDEIKEEIVKYITSETKQISVALRNEKISVYIEFMNSDFNDEYAYTYTKA